MAYDTEKPTKKRKASFVERLAEKLGLNASARTVYSEPVQHDGVTVIPVAKVRWGVGGGKGRKDGQKGEGGGGGVQVAPLGYIEIKDGHSEYRPIRDPASILPVVVVGGITGWVLLRALRKLIRG